MPTTPRRGAPLAAGLAALLLLSACSTSTHGTATTSEAAAATTTSEAPPPPPVIIKPADIPRFLLDAPQVATLLGVPTVQSRPDDYTTFSEFPTGSTFDPPDCVTVAYPQVGANYTAAGAQATNGSSFGDNLQQPTARFEQAVVTFPDATAAQGYLDALSQLWKGCAGKTFTQNMPGIHTTPMVIGHPDTTPTGILNLALASPSGSGWSSVRALAAVGNAVIDTQTGGYNITADAANKFVDAIKAKMP